MENLNYVIFNLNHALREIGLDKLKESVISLAEYGINCGLVSHKSLGDTKQILNDYNNFFSDYFSVITEEVPFNEIEGYLDNFWKYSRDNIELIESKECLLINAPFNDIYLKPHGFQNRRFYKQDDFGTEFAEKVLSSVNLQWNDRKSCLDNPEDLNKETVTKTIKVKGQVKTVLDNLIERNKV